MHRFSSNEMKVSGSNPRANDWTSYVPNGGFGVKRPPALVGLGPSPIAVNFLQEELGHTMSRRGVDFAFMNRSTQASKLSAYGTERSAQSDANWGMEMKGLMGLESGEFDLQRGDENEDNQAIQALADLFTCPATTFPLSVGLFYDSVNSKKTPNLPSSSLTELEGQCSDEVNNIPLSPRLPDNNTNTNIYKPLLTIQMVQLVKYHPTKLPNQCLKSVNCYAHSLYFAFVHTSEDIRILLRLNTKTLPTFCAPLVLVPTLIIFLFSYLLAIAVRFEVGLSLGILGICMHFLILRLEFYGQEEEEEEEEQEEEEDSLVLLTLQTISYRLSQSPNTPHLVLTLIQLMWLAMERQYNPIVVRLQRFMHTSTLPLSTKRAYKRICCLPAFVVVILLTVSILIDLLLLRIFDFNPMEMLLDMRVLPIFVVMSSIIFLGFCASVPSVVNAVFVYLYRPKTPLDKAIEMYSTSGGRLPGKHKKKFHLMDTLTARINSESDGTKPNGNCFQSSLEVADVLPVTSSCEVDILAKKEFANICEMIHAFNFYLQGMEQTRLVVMIDATDITSPTQLAGVFYQVHSLLLTQPNAPVAVVIATNLAAFYEKPSCTPNPNDTVFQESRASESIEALNLLRSISDCNHLVLFSIQLPIFLDSKTVKADSSAIKRLPGASNLVTLFQNSSNTTPVTPNFSSIGLEETNGEPLRRARSKTSELGATPREAISEPNSVMKSATSNTSLNAQNQQTQQASNSSAPSTVVKSVNNSRMTTIKAAAKGIAEIFLASEEIAEQNVPVIRSLVAETAFTNRLIKLKSTNISIKQLVNWIYLTQHWPFHMTWMTILLEEEGLDAPASKESVEESVSSPLRVNPNPLSSLVSKTLEEVSALPPIGSILSGDDRDPAKLLTFVLNQIDCQYSRDDLWQLIDNSLFLNPILRACVKDFIEVSDICQVIHLMITFSRIANLEYTLALDRFLVLIHFCLNKPQKVRRNCLILTKITSIETELTRVHFKETQNITDFVLPNLSFAEIREICFGEGGEETKNAELDLSQSNANITNGKAQKARRDFYVTAPVPQSFETLSQCYDSNINGRSRAAVATAIAPTNNNDSSGDTRSPLPISLDSEQLEKGLCYANPLNLPIFPSCPIRLKSNIPMVELSKMNMDDVCLLLSAISDIPAGNCSTYQTHVRRQNINGQVLSVCDLTKLRSELQMSFGDWQLFKTFIVYLRSLEVGIAERSRNSQTASFAGDIKSHHGSLPISSQYPYSQVLVSHSPFVLCNEQSQPRGKNMFDVPVLVQPVPLESNVANLRQNTDRTTSDFSFGSGTDEFELAWRRDAKPDSLNGNSKYQQVSRDVTSRHYSGHGNPVCAEPADRLSKSTHDLRTPNTSRRSQGHSSLSKTDEKRVERPIRRTDKPTQVFHSTSSASDQLVQMVPAYISRAPETSGMIPVWYPTLPCVGEANKPQEPLHAEDDYSSDSSSASMDGTYDFPSEYSSGDRHSQQQRQSYRRQQCPPSCPHSHQGRRRRRKSSRSSRSSNRTAQRSSSRRSSLGRCSQKSAEGCTCDYFLYQEGQSPRSSTTVNPWTTRSPRKISSPDLSDIEAMTSS
ncbi:unnamed protein product [Rodentolepis nana]|uniref:KAP NTPase domain-containing protein n=1 Tax=Rodentolepis nana TaxID=102285 RepID=A0A0R3TJI3_RODNA|nr:unnamed protein product [Rodentolepis nana]